MPIVLRTPRLALVAALSTLLACGGHSAQLTQERALSPAEHDSDAEKPALVLRPARILNVETGSYFPSGAVLITKGKLIAFVGLPQQIPPGAVEVRLPNTTLLPGLIDAHTHLLHLVDPRVKSDGDAMVLETTGRSDAERALRGARFARELLEAGFTTVRDLGNAGQGADIALRDAIATGHVAGPTMLVTTAALAGERGQFGRRQARLRRVIDHEYAIVSGPREARQAVRKAIAAGADGIKVIVGSETAISLSPKEVGAIVEEAHRAGRWVAAHCTDDAAATIALDAGVDSIEHGYELSDATLERLADKSVALVPTDYPLDFYEGVVAANPYVPDNRREAIAQSLVAQRKSSVTRLRRAVSAGVPIVAGSDAYYPWGKRTRGQIAGAMFRAYAEAGMTPLEIVRSATLRAAKLLRLKTKIGRLSAGMEADIIGVQGDPLRDISALARVRVVINDGVMIVDPRQTQLITQ